VQSPVAGTALRELCTTVPDPIFARLPDFRLQRTTKNRLDFANPPLSLDSLL
jgi:hypothetical protein